MIPARGAAGIISKYAIVLEIFDFSVGHRCINFAEFSPNPCSSRESKNGLQRPFCKYVGALFLKVLWGDIFESWSKILRL
jgi:hypothetical protein